MNRIATHVACAASLWAGIVAAAAAQAPSQEAPRIAIDAQGGSVAADKWCRQIGSGLWECETCGEDEAGQKSYCTITIEHRDP